MLSLPSFDLTRIGDQARQGEGGNPGDTGEDPGQPQCGQHAQDAGRERCRGEQSEDEGAALARLMTTVPRQLGGVCAGLTGGTGASITPTRS